MKAFSPVQDAAKQIGEKQAGTKAELVLRLLGFLGLSQPSPVPPVLLLAVKCAFDLFSPVLASLQGLLEDQAAAN